jgi:excisionase family DNA binding protein
MLVTEAAKYLKIHMHTLKRWQREGRIKPEKRIGKRGDAWYSQKYLDNWLDKEFK